MSQKVKMIWTLLIAGVLLTPIGYWFLRQSPQQSTKNQKITVRSRESLVELSKGEWLGTLREFDSYEYYHYFNLHVPLGRDGEWTVQMEILKKRVHALCVKHKMKTSPMVTWYVNLRRDVYLLVATDRLRSDLDFPSEEWDRLMGSIEKSDTATGSPESWFYVSQMGSARILRSARR